MSFGRRAELVEAPLPAVLRQASGHPSTSSGCLMSFGRRAELVEAPLPAVLRQASGHPSTSSGCLMRGCLMNQTRAYGTSISPCVLKMFVVALTSRLAVRRPPRHSYRRPGCAHCSSPSCAAPSCSTRRGDRTGTERQCWHPWPAAKSGRSGEL